MILRGTDSTDSATAPRFPLLQDCSVPNATLMECPTPAVTLPVAMSTTMRRRRGADDTIAHAVNTAELRFYLGFRLDGVDAYHNMTSGALRLDELRVYEDPALERFDDDVQLYRPYWPYSHRYIVIKVRTGTATSTSRYGQLDRHRYIDIQVRTAGQPPLHRHPGKDSWTGIATSTSR